MKFIKFIVVAFLLVSTATPGAELSASSDDFKCGRADAIQSVQQYVKDTTVSSLQIDSITAPLVLNNKPLKFYINKLNAVDVVISGASTIKRKSATEMNCQADVAIKLPLDVIDVVQTIPEKLSDLKAGGGNLHNHSIVWKTYKYNIRLSDDKQDISVIDHMNNLASTTLYHAVIIAVNKKEIMKGQEMRKLSNIQAEHDETALKFNAIWDAMPEQVRVFMDTSRQEWIQEEKNTCGEISEAVSETKPARYRISIYECRVKMLRERIAFFNGAD